MVGMALLAQTKWTHTRDIMSKKDTSLENIDIVKLLIFILIFALICLIMIFAFIVPNIKEYKNLNSQNRSASLAHAKVKMLYDNKLNTLDSIKENSRFILSAYDTNFDKDKFLKFATGFFSDVSLNEIKHVQTASEDYFLFELNVTSAVNSPTKFYDFLDALAKYENIIKAEFPIVMKGDDKLIRTTFNIKVYGKPNSL